MTASTKKTTAANVQKDYSCFPSSTPKRDAAIQRSKAQAEARDNAPKFDKGAKPSKKTKTVSGERITIPADAYEGLPALRYNRDTQRVNVVGLGRAGGFTSSTDWLRFTSFRNKFTNVGSALMVQGLPLDEALIKAGINTVADLKKKGAAFLASITDGPGARWATQAETDAYILQERALRQRFFSKASDRIERDLKGATSDLADALNDVGAAEKAVAAKLEVLETQRKIAPKQFPNASALIKAAESALLDAAKLHG